MFAHSAASTSPVTPVFGPSTPLIAPVSIGPTRFWTITTREPTGSAMSRRGGGGFSVTGPLVTCTSGTGRSTVSAPVLDLPAFHSCALLRKVDDGTPSDTLLSGSFVYVPPS